MHSWFCREVASSSPEFILELLAQTRLLLFVFVFMSTLKRSRKAVRRKWLIKAKGSNPFAAVGLVATAIRDHSKQTARERKRFRKASSVSAPFEDESEGISHQTGHKDQRKVRPPSLYHEDGGMKADVSLIYSNSSLISKIRATSFLDNRNGQNQNNSCKSLF